jgi:lipoprotein-anchoring transpeptidase ErfK/SrfK
MTTIFANRLINLAACTMLGFGALLGWGADTAAAAATKIVARVSISQQKMQVMIDGREAFEWKVSTAGKGYVTPIGSFTPTRMHEMWYSKKYDNAPMPHSVFFHGGYAVHATPYVKRLGRPASHGCIRLHPDNAADFYELVQVFGPSNTRIVIVE